MSVDGGARLEVAIRFIIGFDRADGVSDYFAPRRGANGGSFPRPVDLPADAVLVPLEAGRARRGLDGEVEPAAGVGHLDELLLDAARPDPDGAVLHGHAAGDADGVARDATVDDALALERGRLVVADLDGAADRVAVGRAPGLVDRRGPVLPLPHARLRRVAVHGDLHRVRHLAAPLDAGAGHARVGRAVLGEAARLAEPAQRVAPEPAPGAVRARLLLVAAPPTDARETLLAVARELADSPEGAAGAALAAAVDVGLADVGLPVVARVRVGAEPAGAGQRNAVRVQLAAPAVAAAPAVRATAVGVGLLVVVEPVLTRRPAAALVLRARPVGAEASARARVVRTARLTDRPALTSLLLGAEAALAVPAHAVAPDPARDPVGAPAAGVVPAAVDAGLEAVADAVGALVLRLLAGHRVSARAAHETDAAVGIDATALPFDARRSASAAQLQALVPAATDVAVARAVHAVRVRGAELPVRALRADAAAVDVRLVLVAEAVVARRLRGLLRGVARSVARARLAVVRVPAVPAVRALRADAAAVDVGLVLVAHAVVARGHDHAPPAGAEPGQAVGVAAAELVDPAPRAHPTTAVDVGLGAVEDAVLTRDLVDGVARPVEAPVGRAVGVGVAAPPVDARVADATAVDVRLVLVLEAVVAGVGVGRSLARVVEARAARAVRVHRALLEVAARRAAPPAAVDVGLGAVAGEIRAAAGRGRGRRALPGVVAHEAGHAVAEVRAGPARAAQVGAALPARLAAHGRRPADALAAREIAGLALRALAVGRARADAVPALALGAERVLVVAGLPDRPGAVPERVGVRRTGEVDGPRDHHGREGDAEVQVSHGPSSLKVVEISGWRHRLFSFWLIRGSQHHPVLASIDKKIN